jgi:methyl-accepting chemotaxis protein
MNFFGRRHFIINKDLQFSLLTISIFYLLLFLVVIGSILFIPVMIELDQVDYASDEAYQAASKILYLHSKFWPAVILAILVIGLHSIRTSHKIAGPLYRFGRLFETMKEGNLPKKVTIRKGDYFINEVELINEMLESLQIRVQEIKDAQSSLNEAISECKDVVSHASKDEIIKRMNEITVKGDQLGEKLAYFKIASKSVAVQDFKRQGLFHQGYNRFGSLWQEK